MKKKHKVPALELGLRDACAWTKTCAFIEDDEISCSSCGAADTDPLTRHKAQTWWKNRIEELNKEK